MPVLALFFLGMVDLGLFMRSNVEVTTLARNGALVASSEPGLSSSDSEAASVSRDTVKAIAISASTLDFEEMEVTIYRATPDDPDPATACSTNSTDCVIYRGSAEGLTYYKGGYQPSDSVCSGGDDDYVGVVVRARHDWLANVFGTSTTYVTGRTVMKVEPFVCPPPE